MTKALYAFDLVILGYMAVITAIVLAAWPEGAWIYLGYHALVLILMGLVIGVHARYGGRLWTIARYWYVVVVVLAAFRELHYLIPQVHPFGDFRYDRALAAIDRRWLGDVDYFFVLILRPGIVDFLHLCYWFYFVSILIPGAVLHRRGEFGALRRYVTVVLTGMYLSYLGYILVPAIGPHHFHATRPAALDGYIGGVLHRALIEIEWMMPDAFPSGHALMQMVTLLLAWRMHRPSFWALLVPCTGCIVATVALRYHYVVDVAASVALLPVVMFAGTAIHSRWERAVAGRPSPTP